jgi:hypothetical protein
MRARSQLQPGRFPPQRRGGLQAREFLPIGLYGHDEHIARIKAANPARQLLRCKASDRQNIDTNSPIRLTKYSLNINLLYIFVYKIQKNDCRSRPIGQNLIPARLRSSQR